jgi:hypothetical protein
MAGGKYNLDSFFQRSLKGLFALPGSCSLRAAVPRTFPVGGSSLAWAHLHGFLPRPVEQSGG